MVKFWTCIWCSKLEQSNQETNAGELCSPADHLFVLTLLLNMFASFKDIQRAYSLKNMPVKDFVV
ncbi:hypothetical protein BVRB_2g044130 isoform B [Beta vulgaris subsp. vulgaris]|nr:hypothetical protein BVRB_2g044130 isoform B [Beta vulgaris subsp. vulgaris]